MSETEATAGGAGTRFPFISLEKAIGRAKELFDADQKGREMTIAGAFGTWEYSEKSSGGFQTVAALKMYGLLKDSTAGGGRKVQLTDAALRYFRDEREEEKQKLAREFALKPKLVAVLWKDWHTSPPGDTIARSHLKTDRGLNEQGSRSLLAIYKENLAFTNLKPDDKVPEPEAEDGEGGGGDARTPPPLKPPARLEVKVMPGERIVFVEENNPQQYVKLVASGDVDATLLDALQDYVKRQKKRLGLP